MDRILSMTVLQITIIIIIYIIYICI